MLEWVHILIWYISEFLYSGTIWVVSDNTTLLYWWLFSLYFHCYIGMESLLLLGVYRGVSYTELQGECSSVSHRKCPTFCLPCVTIISKIWKVEKLFSQWCYHDSEYDLRSLYLGQVPGASHNSSYTILGASYKMSQKWQVLTTSPATSKTLAFAMKS